MLGLEQLQACRAGSHRPPEPSFHAENDVFPLGKFHPVKEPLRMNNPLDDIKFWLEKGYPLRRVSPRQSSVG
jgi:hypothetical protein